MKKKLTEVVDQIVTAYEQSGGQFSVKQVKEDVLAAYEAGDVIDDLVAAAIDKAVERRDRASHSEPDDQLRFDDFAFPRTLVIGDNERQPSRTAFLRHVLADQAMKEEANIRSNEAMQRTRRRNLALLPYLERGLTVADAIATYATEATS